MRAGVARNGDSDQRRLPAVMFLAVLLSLAAQLAVAAQRVLTNDRPNALPAPYALGDTVRFLEARGSDGGPVQLSLAGTEATATVLYAFHSECVHCRAVAPAWAERFAVPDVASSRVQRVAVTQEDPTAAVHYANRFRWNVDVLSLSHLSPRNRALLLVSRTPWVFVFDSAGVLRHHGHGSDLAKVEHVLRSIEP